MGDGAAERRLFGLFLVDMDELVVASAIGELVDLLLVDQQPVGMAQVLADIGRQVVDGDGGHGVLHGNIVVGPLGGSRDMVARAPGRVNGWGAFIGGLNAVTVAQAGLKHRVAPLGRTSTSSSSGLEGSAVL